MRLRNETGSTTKMFRRYAAKLALHSKPLRRGQCEIGLRKAIRRQCQSGTAGRCHRFANGKLFKVHATGPIRSRARESIRISKLRLQSVNRQIEILGDAPNRRRVPLVVPRRTWRVLVIAVGGDE